jgi:hypothetical protein
MLHILKVEVIVQFPPPCKIPQLQILQRKENFLRRFVANYVDIAKGFMHLLKKGVPFCWDEATHCSFKELKRALTSGPLLRPPDYNRDFFLCLVVAKLAIIMVLVQEDDLLKEHVIYYLSQGVVGPERNYSHVENLALSTMHAIQRSCHYIMLHNTIVNIIVNPFQYVLTQWVIGGKISTCILIFQ